jgi:putative ABC transport system permease protein
LDVSEAKSGIVGLDGTMVEKIRNMAGVNEISPSFQLSAQGHLDDVSADLVVAGVEPAFFKLGGIRVSSGETMTDANETGVIIASSMAQIFGKQSTDEMLGKEFVLDFFVPAAQTDATDEQGSGDAQASLDKVTLDKKFKVIGVVAGEENVVYIDSKALTELKIDKFSQMKVRCSSQQTMGTIRDDILNEGLLVSSLSDTVDQANQIFSIVQIVLMLFGVIALAVSAIGMFNTMTITLLERTQEIGIMKAIGASDGGVSMMFIMESTIMGFLGGLCGVVMGFLGGQIFNRVINLVASRFGGQSVSLFYSPLWFVMGIIVFSALVGFITGFVPARRASKIDPLDALRYK